MSGANREGAMEIEARAAAWLGRRDSESWSNQDQSDLDAWLAQSGAHRAAFWRLEFAWNYADRLTALRLAAAPEQIARSSGGTRRSSIAKIAAAIVAIAVLGISGTLYFSRPGERVYVTAIGGHETVTLEDGSRVTLNTDTVLRTAMSGDRKIAWLDRGEAYFQVRHDALRPFVVIAGTRRVTDLGTKFLVRRDADQLRVAVVEGRVQLDGAGQGKQSRSTLLVRGDIAVAAQNALSVTRNSSGALANQLGWLRGLLVFKRTTLADAATEFNRYNQHKLVVADNAAAQLKIDGTFRTNNVEAFTDIAQDILGLRVERRGGETVISR